MKILHLSDLHLGKRLNEFSLLADQKYILDEILEILDTQKADCVIIAGDVYDKTVPSAEAVALFDSFLASLAQRKVQTFVISGNHDSPERIAFGSRLMTASGIHMSPVYNGQIQPIALADEFGTVNFYLLPFVKPMHIRRCFPEETVDTYTDAIACAVRQMAVETGGRNVLVTHQFVTGSRRSESEELSVGGSDNVDVSALEGFDYVALGHIHSPQNCGGPNVRYCGTPLKYSFSEAQDQKSVTLVELQEKGNVQISTIPLTPLHEMRECRGTFAQLTEKSYYENTTLPTDYVHLTLTDEEDIPDAIGKLRLIYQNLMKLDYDNARTRANQEITGAEIEENLSPMQLFADFYVLQNQLPMSQAQMVFLEELLEKIKEGME